MEIAIKVFTGLERFNKLLVNLNKLILIRDKENQIIYQKYNLL